MMFISLLNILIVSAIAEDFKGGSAMDLIGVTKIPKKLDPKNIKKPTQSICTDSTGHTYEAKDDGYDRCMDQVSQSIKNRQNGQPQPTVGATPAPGVPSVGVKLGN